MAFVTYIPLEDDTALGYCNGKMSEETVSDYCVGKVCLFILFDHLSQARRSEKPVNTHTQHTSSYARGCIDGLRALVLFSC